MDTLAPSCGTLFARCSPQRYVSPSFSPPVFPLTKDNDQYVPDTQGKWRCLSNPEIVLDFSQVNDDFCDCPDGSDEPGTGACRNGMFYCENSGFEPSYIPSYKVNDGLCDYQECCDGSEEYLISCPNRCDEMRETHAKAVAEQNAILQKGLLAKQSIQKVAQKQKRQQESRFQSLNLKINKKYQLLDDLNEKKVSEKYVPLWERLQHDIQLTTKAVRERDSAISRAKKALERGKVEQAQTILEKSATPLPDLRKPIQYLDNEYRQLFERASVEVKVDLKQIWRWLIGEHTPGNIPINDGLVEAQLDNLNKEIESLNEEISAIQDDLSSDRYGPDGILRAYKDECLKERNGGYDYQVCFTRGLHQISPEGNTVLIGTIQEVVANEDNSLSLVFKDGEKCWNGPYRRAKVDITCGTENHLESVTEPQKCHYSLKMVSPIACVGDLQHIKDEL